MKHERAVHYFITGALLAAPLTWCAKAQDSPSGAPAATAAAAKAGDSAKPPTSVEQGTVTDKDPAAALSPSVAEVLKMLGAGVSKDVVKVYVENASVASDLTAADLIALKQHGVADDVTTALVKRSAELRAQAAQTNTAAAPARAPATAPAPRPNYGYLDPESHDFWFQYYAYPRALAYANQRMYGYYPGVGFGTPYAYGYYPGMALNAYAPAYYGRPGPVWH